MAGRACMGDARPMTRIRRGAVWFAISLLVFVLVATLLLDEAA
jgi:hypothetical protein